MQTDMNSKPDLGKSKAPTATGVSASNTLNINPDRLLSRTEVAEHFGISKRFLEVSIYAGNGPPHVRIGRSVRHRIVDVRNWIEGNLVQPGQ